MAKAKEAAATQKVQYENRLKTRYKEEIISALIKNFGYKNIMQVPKVEKIILNMRLGRH